MWEDADSTGFEPAIASFREALQRAWSSPDAERQVVEAFQRYSGAFYEALQLSEAAQRAPEAYGEYLRRVNEAFPTDAERTRVHDAFRAYVRTVKAAWAAVDPETITPAELAGIAEGMNWVSGVVGVIQTAGESWL